MERPPLSFLPSTDTIAELLTGAFTEGPWRVDDLVERGALILGRRWRWLRPLALRVFARFGSAARPASECLLSFLVDDRRFRAACEKHDVTISAEAWASPVMWPAAGAPATWNVPEILTPVALAELLSILPGELDWFADCQTRLRKIIARPLGHYVYRWQPKADGAARLIEAPKPRLKAIQRALLEQIVDRVPPHDAAHGFRRGRSVRTFAAPHVGRRVVLKMDLRDFFPMISAARVRSLFRTAGYPDPVARVLTGLCTNSVPHALWDDPSCPVRGTGLNRVRRLFRYPHLPQGSPTSPALANLCAYRLDVRLSKLAESIGACYTRYADDMAISGDRRLERSIERFHVHACAIALEEGFEINTRKTHVMRQGVRQRLAGIVVNERPNVARDEFDRLKATLHNCACRGAAGENRAGHSDFRAHLAGLVAHVASINPDRGHRLRAIFDRIAW